jgi:hypothetical protein
MAEVTFGITASGRIDLNESEMRALYTLTLWGDDAFIRVFGDKLGKDLEHNGGAAGIKSLFARIREQIPPVLNNLDKARALLLEHYKEKKSHG